MGNLEYLFMVIAAIVGVVAAVDVLLDLFDWTNRRNNKKESTK